MYCNFMHNLGCPLECVVIFCKFVSCHIYGIVVKRGEFMGETKTLK